MPSYSIEVVRRAVQVLRVVADAPHGISLADVSREVGASRASVFRLLATLSEEEMVEQDPESKKYRLGVGVISLGQRALESTDIVEVAQPHLKALAERFPVVTYLNVPAHSSVVCIERVPRLAGVHFVPAGMSLPYHACASGLVLLAFGRPALLDRALQLGTPKLASGTIDSEIKLRRELREVRRLGYATDLNSLEEGIQSVAMPIWDHRGQVIAALGLSSTTAALDDGGWEALRREGLRAASEISARLGADIASRAGRRGL